MFGVSKLMVVDMHQMLAVVVLGAYNRGLVFLFSSFTSLFLLSVAFVRKKVPRLLKFQVFVEFQPSLAL